MARFASLRAWQACFAADRARILAALEEKTKRLALQAYVIERGACYRSMTCGELASAFELAERVVRKEVNALLLQGLVSASWDEEEAVLLFEEAVPNRVEVLAEQLMEKVNELMESNERVKEELNGEKREESGKGKMKRATGVFGQRGVRSKVKVNRGCCVCCSCVLLEVLKRDVVSLCVTFVVLTKAWIAVMSSKPSEANQRDEQSMPKKQSKR